MTAQYMHVIDSRMETFDRLRNNGMTAAQVADDLGISCEGVHRWLVRHGELERARFMHQAVLDEWAVKRNRRRNNGK